MEIREAEVIVWHLPDRGSQWELWINCELAGRGNPTSKQRAEDVGAWLGQDLRLPNGPVGYRVATEEEIAERQRELRYFAEVEDEKRRRGLGIVEPRRRSSRDLIDVMWEHEAE